jgi:hypothetical protein
MAAENDHYAGLINDTSFNRPASGGATQTRQTRLV